MKPALTLIGATATLGLALAVYPQFQTPKELSEAEIVALLTTLYEKQDALPGDKYVQVLEGGAYPSYETGRLSNVTIPEGVRIDVYEGPKGKGYQVIYETETMIYSYGFGPESVERTYTQPIIATDKSASST